MFKKLSLMLSILSLPALLLVSQGWSQQQTPLPGLGTPVPGRAERHYNPQAVETLVGKVVSLNRMTPKRAGQPERVIMQLQTDKGNVKVFLGPADYIDQQVLKLAPGDQVEVKGIQMNRAKVTIFIAGAVKKGDQVLQLRDEATGRPLWGKGKKRSRAT
jgi:hypothetical protein